MVAVLGHHDHLRQAAGFNTFAATTLAQVGIKNIPKIDLSGTGPAPSQDRVDALGATKRQLEGIVLAGKAQGADKPATSGPTPSSSESGGGGTRRALLGTAMAFLPFGIVPMSVGIPLAAAGLAHAMSGHAAPAPAASKVDSRIKPSVGYFRDIPKPGQKEVSAFGGYAGGGYGANPAASKRGASFAAQAAPVAATPARGKVDYFSKPNARTPEASAAFGAATVTPQLYRSAQMALREVNQTVGGLEAKADKGGFSVTGNLGSFDLNTIGRRREILMDGRGMTAGEVGLDLDGLKKAVGKRTLKPTMAFSGPFKANALTLG